MEALLRSLRQLARDFSTVESLQIVSMAKNPFPLRVSGSNLMPKEQFGLILFRADDKHAPVRFRFHMIVKQSLLLLLFSGVYLYISFNLKTWCNDILLLWYDVKRNCAQRGRDFSLRQILCTAFFHLRGWTARREHFPGALPCYRKKSGTHHFVECKRAL